jgi:hypothetical protein
LFKLDPPFLSLTTTINNNNIKDTRSEMESYGKFGAQLGRSQ